MSRESLLPRSVTRALEVGVLSFAVAACGGGLSNPNSTPDSGPDIPALTQTAPLDLESISTPTVNIPSEQAPSLVPTQKPVFINCDNCFWMPDLSVPRGFPELNKPTPIKKLDCGVGVVPDGVNIYSWECAGKNNLFILGHAYEVFKPLRFAYKNGQLKTGEIAYHTDGKGEEQAYEIAWVNRSTVAEWGKGSSWADSPTPVITLDTCDDGKVAGDSAYRIIVRLVPVPEPTNSPSEAPTQ